MLNIKRLQRVYNIRLRKHRLNGARGMSIKDRDGYLILLDDRLSPEQTEKSLDHEMLHIIMGHLDDRQDLTETTQEKEVTAVLAALYGG